MKSENDNMDIRDILKRRSHFCIKPWIHLSIFPNKNIQLCCVTTTSISLGNFNENNKEIIRSNEQRMEIQKKILDDEVLDFCSNCYMAEGSGNVSERMKTNHLFSNEIKHLFSDSTKNKHYFLCKSLDIRFDNICNFKCRTCDSHNSRKWNEDFQPGHNCPPENWSWNDRLSKKLENILDKNLKLVYFAGGEPLINKFHYLFLERLKTKFKTTAISYNTNLSTISFQGKSFVDFWKKFDNITVSASLDGIFSQGEYIRKGLHFESFCNNLNKLLSELPNCSFDIAITISRLNVLHVIKLFDFFIENYSNKKLSLTVFILKHPDYYDIRNIHEKAKKELCSIYNTYIKKYYLQKDENHIRSQAIKNLIYIKRIMKSKKTDNQEYTCNFFTINGKLDSIRNESFTEQFPTTNSILVKS